MPKNPDTVLNMMCPPDLNQYFTPIRPQLEKVETALRRALITGIGPVDQVLSAVCTRGKRLRPALLLLFASLARVSRVAVDLAVGVELLHWATLVHDDVVDGALSRRGAPSVNARWGNGAAVLVGDFLFARAYDCLTSGGPSACRIADELIRGMAEGEIMQFRTLFDPARDEANYLECIKRKTAGLFAESCRLGADAVRADPPIRERAYRYGLALGMAFQIADDLLDFESSAPTGPAPGGRDLHQGVLTLPAIRLLQTSPGSRFVPMLKQRRLDGRTIRSLVAAASKCGAVEYARETARRYLGQANCELDGMRRGAQKETLGRIADFVAGQLN